jgi:hypothetical protein
VRAPQARGVESLRVAHVQLGHLALLDEEERLGDRPSSIAKRIQYLRGALYPLLLAATRANSMRAEAAVVIALLAAESRVPEAGAGAAATHAAACRALLGPLREPDETTPEGRRDRALLRVAALLARRQPTPAAVEELRAALRCLRHASTFVEAGSAALAADARARAAFAEFAGTLVQPVRLSEGAELAVSAFVATEALRRSIRSRSIEGVSPITPLVGMCSADQARRLIRRARGSRRSSRDAARTADGALERQLGVAWLDLSWLIVGSDPARLDRVRRAAVLALPQTWSVDDYARFLRQRAELLTESGLLLEEIESAPLTAAYGRRAPGI